MGSSEVDDLMPRGPAPVRWLQGDQDVGYGSATLQVLVVLA